MRELRQYAEPVLKIICLILAVCVVIDVAGIFIRWNPFRGVTLPEVPSLAVGTNAPSAGGHGTNPAVITTVIGTNNPHALAGTNSAPALITARSNSVPPSTPAANESNSVAPAETTKAATNLVARLETGTNSAPATNTTVKGTNELASATGTNTTPVLKPDKKQTNAPPGPEMAGMNFNQPPGKRGGDLSPALQAQISKIVDSEILGPVIRPLPMALLGIAGEFVFLRSASGQTGLVKEGDSLGDLKLLRIGINRVLVEQNGQKQELMIFSGYGGESLLPTNTPNENNHP